MFTNGKRAEEEVIVDNGTFGLEYSNDKNIASFLEAANTLNYGNSELFQHFGKTLEDTRKDLWNNVVENNYKHDPTDVPGLQTTANFKLTPEKYQEVICW